MTWVGTTLNAFSVVRADLLTAGFASSFACLAAIGKTRESIVDFAITIIVFVVADFFFGDAVGTALQLITALFARGTSLFGHPDEATFLVLGTGFEVSVPYASEFPFFTGLGRTRLGNAFAIVTDFVRGAALFLRCPIGTSIIAFDTQLIFAGKNVRFGCAFLFVEFTDGRIGAVFTGFPVDAITPETATFTGLVTFDTDVEICGGTASDRARLTLGTNIQHTEWAIRAFAVLVFQTCKATTTT